MFTGAFIQCVYNRKMIVFWLLKRTTMLLRWFEFEFVHPLLYYRKLNEIRLKDFYHDKFKNFDSDTFIFSLAENG